MYKRQGNVFPISVLAIEASRSITVSNLSVHSRSSAFEGVFIAKDSQDVRLLHLTIDGAGVFGILVGDNSQASLAQLTVRDPGYAAVGVYGATVGIEDCLFENSTGANWKAGLDVGAGRVGMHGTTIRNMQNGMNIQANSNVGLDSGSSYYPSGGKTDVVIENPAGTNFCGVCIGTGASLNLNVTLRITNAGQSWGGNTAGVLVSGGTLAIASGNGGKLVVSGSYGNGVFVSNSSHVGLEASSITGSQHGGLVVVNQSTTAVAWTDPLTVISGNGTDLFCDSKSLITGGANIANATSVQCSNLLPGDYENVP